MTLYDQKLYQQAIAGCNAASNALDPDMPRVRSIIIEKPPRLQADEGFALERCFQVFNVVYTKGRLASALGQKALAHRFARDAADWILSMAALIQGNNPHHTTETYKSGVLNIATFRQELDTFEPGTFTAEVARQRQRFGNDVAGLSRHCRSFHKR